MEQTLRARGYCGFRPARLRLMVATGPLVELQQAPLWRVKSRLEGVLVGLSWIALATAYSPTQALRQGSASASWPKH